MGKAAAPGRSRRGAGPKAASSRADGRGSDRVADGGNDRTNRRERILDVATELFAERGFLATAIDDVGEAAGVTGPAVYRHFESKQHLLAAVVRRVVEDLEAAEARVVERAKSPAEALDGLIHTMIETALDSSGAVNSYFRLLLEGSNLPDADRRWLRGIYQDQRRRWVSLLLELRPDFDEEEAELNVEGAFWLARSAVAVPTRMERWRRMRHTVAMVRRVLIGDDPADPEQP